MNNDVRESSVPEKETENGDSQDLLTRWNVPIAVAENGKSKNNSTNGSSKKESGDTKFALGCVAVIVGICLLVAFLAPDMLIFLLIGGGILFAVMIIVGIISKVE